MVWKITTESAGTEYERRYERPWRVDASLGTFVAMNALLRVTVIRGVVVHGRALARRRLVKGASPLPEWCHDALVRYCAKVGPFTGADAPLALRSLTSPVFVKLADKLAGDVSVVQWGPDEKQLIEALLPAAEEILGRFNEKRRRDETLFGFYAGVRVMAHWSRSEEITASQVALLAAAVGVEPFETTLSPARKRWEKRISSWRGEMDAERWREVAASVPWSPTLAVALPG